MKKGNISTQELLGVKSFSRNGIQTDGHGELVYFMITPTNISVLSRVSIGQKVHHLKQSGKDFNRPGYKRLMKKLKPEDTLVIKSIDRLGRNYDEILEQWRFLTKEKHVDILVLDMPLLDTRNGRDLTGTLIADIVLQLLSYVAQTEREFIKQRQREGIEVAKANGVHLGRKAMERPENYEDVKSAWMNGEVSMRGAAKLLGISHTAFRSCVQND